MRIGVAHHLGWAVVVTASDDHEVVDRRRVALLGPGLPVAPIHHRGGTHRLHDDGPPLDDDELAALVAEVVAAATAATAAALDDLVPTLPGPVTSLSVRDWADDIPDDIARLRRPPYESRADSVMYLRILAGAGRARGWAVHRFDAATVERDAALLLGDRADEVLHGPRARLGAPWAKDHRMALAATVLSGRQDR